MNMAGAALKASWKDEILRDVPRLEKVGTPGTLIVVGDDAQPVIAANGANILLAAATYKKGRTVVFSHNGYLDKFENLMGSDTIFVRNVIKWASNGKLNGQNVSSDVVRVDGMKELPKDLGSKVVIWEGAFNQAPTLLAEVDKFVQDGGGLITGTTPWGILQLNPDKKIADMAIHPLLCKIGIYYTEDYLDECDGGFQFPQHCADLKCHFGECLCRLEECYHEDGGGHGEKFAVMHHTLASGLKCLPKDILSSDQVCHKLEVLVKALNHVVSGHDNSCQDYETLCKKADENILCLYNILLYQTPDRKAPAIADFPGDFAQAPETTTVRLSFTSTPYKDIHATGYYLPAGRKMNVKVVSVAKSETPWKFLIGCHTDDLTSLGNTRRWPKMCSQVPITKEEAFELGSPFGGLLYVEDPGNTGKRLELQLDNVVAAPYFDVMDPLSVGKWKNSRTLPGLWADIKGEHITITLPSSSIRGISEPSAAIKFWDEVVKAHHFLRGTDPLKHKKQWVVTDKQPVAGYMHAGYPVVTHLDVADPKANNFLLGNKLRERGSWGMFHEIGHNMQRGEWTFEGTGEVTVNIFTLHAFEKICNVKPWIHPWLKNQVKSAVAYLKQGASFQNWKNDPCMALFVYAQLQVAFGWEAYKRVFAEYEMLLANKSKSSMEKIIGMSLRDDIESTLPTSDEGKIDQWIVRFSKVVGYNLIPLFEFWGFPIRASVEEKLRTLQPYLPDDEITRAVPDRAEAILQCHPNCYRKQYVSNSLENGQHLVL